MNTINFGQIPTVINHYPVLYTIDALELHGDSNDPLNRIPLVYRFKCQSKSEGSDAHNFVVNISSIMKQFYFKEAVILHDEAIRYGLHKIKSSSQKKEFDFFSDDLKAIKNQKEVEGKELRNRILRFFYDIYAYWPDFGITESDVCDNFYAPSDSINKWIENLCENDNLLPLRGFVPTKLNRQQVKVKRFRINPKFEKEIEKELFIKSENENNESERNLADYINLEKAREIGEGDFIEFKASMLYDLETKQKNDELGFEIVKTIQAFQNSKGGVLFIGVKDNGELFGIKNDYKLLGRKQNKDAFLLRLKDLLINHMDRFVLGNITLDIENYNNIDYCIVLCKPSKSPVYSKYKTKKRFIIRVGAASVELDIEDASKYISGHFAN